MPELAIYEQIYQICSSAVREERDRSSAQILQKCLPALKTYLNAQSQDNYESLCKASEAMKGLNQSIADTIITQLPPEILKNRLFAFPFGTMLYQAASQNYAQADLQKCLANLGYAGHRCEAALIGYVKAGHVQANYVLRKANKEAIIDSRELDVLLRNREPELYLDKIGRFRANRFGEKASPDDAVWLTEIITQNSEFAKYCANNIPVNTYFRHRKGKNLRDKLLNMLSEDAASYNGLLGKLAQYDLIRLAAILSFKHLRSAQKWHQKMIKNYGIEKEIANSIQKAMTSRHMPERRGVQSPPPLRQKKNG